jgi:methylenetetrahydrofolate reductase (NADPH)
MSLPPTLSEPERAALARALGEAYYEIFPSGSIEERLRALPGNSYLAVTCSPSKGVEPTLALCERLVAAGFRVVPHVSARTVRDEAHLAEILRRLDELPIDCLFVPGGDAARPEGRFASAFELLRALAGHAHKFREVGIAAHPEGHPAVDDATLLAELEKKQPYATYLVTQMCFDARALERWLRAIRARGVALPVWIGLPGVADPAALLATSLRIGVGDSLRYLRHHAGLAARLLLPAIYSPDELLFDLAPALADPALGVAGFHVFCFNQVATSEEWRSRFLARLAGDGAPPGPGAHP